MKYYLLGYFIAYMGLAFVLPSYRVWKQTGINPFVFKNTDTAHDYAGKMMKILIAMLFAIIAINAFVDFLMPYFVPVRYLIENVYVFWIGVALLHISLIWTIVAQAQMQKSWRIGIDETHDTELVSTGIFRWSRNPIFLGMLCTVLGLFLIIPNVVTFAVWFGAYIVLQMQVRLEEEFLRRKHGEKYAEFCKKVRRWI
jgi:protein-S-isoprenylcysteine O-methyltransferase Ste14